VTWTTVCKDSDVNEKEGITVVCTNSPQNYGKRPECMHINGYLILKQLQSSMEEIQDSEKILIKTAQ